MNDLETAQAYRERAEELRRLAANYRHEGSRQDLRRLADEWDQMAARIEERQRALGFLPIDVKPPQRKTGH